MRSSSSSLQLPQKERLPTKYPDLPLKKWSIKDWLSDVDEYGTKMSFENGFEYKIEIIRKYAIDLSFKVRSIGSNHSDSAEINILIDSYEPRYQKKFNRMVSFSKTPLIHIHTNIPLFDLEEDSPYLRGSKFSLYISIQNQLKPTNNQMRLTISETSTVHRAPLIAPVPQIASFNGLKNLGATCYMNAVIQSLFHIQLFRKLVFSTDSESVPGENGVVLQSLQNLFARLQLGHKSASTHDLITSFGWKDTDSIIQHDIHEFRRSFYSILEKMLCGTSSLKDFYDIFKGQFHNSITSSSGEERTIIEDFYDILVTVKGFSTLEESLHDYFLRKQTDTHTVTLDSKIIKAPKVLSFLLSRFEYDKDKGQTKKLFSAFSYPDTIDISKFSLDTGNTQYDLYAVLSHAGNSYSGHYTAYIKISGEWYKFNDSNVTVSSHYEAVESNFGSEDKQHAAYQLIYTSQTSREELFSSMTGYVIPDTIVQHFKQNIKSPTRRKTRVFTVFSVASIQKMGSCGNLAFSNSLGKCISMPVESSTSRLFEACSKELGMKLSETRLFTISGFVDFMWQISPSSQKLIGELARTSLFAVKSSKPYSSSRVLALLFVSSPSRFAHLKFSAAKLPRKDSTPSKWFKLVKEQSPNSKMVVVTSDGLAKSADPNLEFSILFNGRSGGFLIFDYENRIEEGTSFVDNPV